ncbi:DUF3861 domain-containing protein [Neisseria sp. Ec49-e6-T10]|uniref:DUF3861 domain-containing protein n=1 Tax=Neisseria sp. Ec49-e6-T10 TaxID=3140744 RepID=UPI003EC06779
MSKHYQYQLKLTALTDKEGQQMAYEPLMFQFENHDNIFDIIESIKSKGLFEKESEAIEMAIGLKLFSEVMLKNKNHDLFEEFQPQFMQFMKKLKSSVKSE